MRQGGLETRTALNFVVLLASSFCIMAVRACSRNPTNRVETKKSSVELWNASPPYTTYANIFLHMLRILLASPIFHPTSRSNMLTNKTDIKKNVIESMRKCTLEWTYTPMHRPCSEWNAGKASEGVGLDAGVVACFWVTLTLHCTLRSSVIGFIARVNCALSNLLAIPSVASK